MCFVVFCGVLRVFCDILRVFCECFVSVSQYFYKSHKTHEKHRQTHWKTQKNYNTLVYCGRFLRAKNRDCVTLCILSYCKKHLLQNICKTPQNTAKHSQNAKQPQHVFCEILSHNTAKRTQNAPKKTKRS